MPSSATARNRFEKQGTGDNTNTWGQKLNTTGLDLIDEALDGFESIAITGNLTLTSTNYATDQARKRSLKFTGTGPATITIPAVSKLYFIWNATNDTLTISSGGTATAQLGVGARQWVMCDGSGVYTDNSAPIAVSGAASAAFSAAEAAGSAESATASANAAGASASSASTSAASASNSATAAAASAASVNDSTLVHKSGTETISGLKTFASGISISGQTLDGLTAFGVSLAEAADANAANTLLGGRNWTQLSTASGGASIVQTGLANYTELFIALDGISHSAGASVALILYTSENNGTSYGSGNAVTASVSNSTAVSGAVHVIFTAKSSMFVPASANTFPPSPTSVAQAAKPNAIKLEWGSGTLDGGIITILAR